MFKANQSAESENPPQAEDSAGQTGKGWFLYKQWFLVMTSGKYGQFCLQFVLIH